MELACKLLVCNSLTKSQYQAIINFFFISNGSSKVFPSYKMVSKVKNFFLPSCSTFTDTIARVQIQSVIENTVREILRNLSINFESETELKFIFKAGIDGQTIKLTLNSKMKFTMVDQKSVNFFTRNSASTRCYICRKKLSKILRMILLV